MDAQLRGGQRVESAVRPRAPLLPIVAGTDRDCVRRRGEQIIEGAVGLCDLLVNDAVLAGVDAADDDLVLEVSPQLLAGVGGSEGERSDPRKVRVVLPDGGDAEGDILKCADAERVRVLAPQARPLDAVPLPRAPLELVCCVGQEVLQSVPLISVFYNLLAHDAFTVARRLLNAD